MIDVVSRLGESCYKVFEDALFTSHSEDCVIMAAGGS